MTKIKLSVNKFCEYGRSTSPKRRQDILKAQKYPKTGDGFPQYYSTVRNHVINFICSRDQSELDTAINKIDSRGDTTQWYITDNKISKELLASTQNLDLTIFSDYDLKPFSEKRIINIYNVGVKTNPDILIYQNEKVFGCIKTHFSKTFPLGEDSRLDIALLLYKSLENDYPSLNPKYCFSIDVPTGNISSSKKSFKRRFERLEYTASEISNLWDTIKADLS